MLGEERLRQLPSTARVRRDVLEADRDDNGMREIDDDQSDGDADGLPEPLQEDSPRMAMRNSVIAT